MTEPLRLETLDHDQLVVLAHEALLAGHLIDRAAMPQVVSLLGVDPMADIAIEEWMGASPIYTRRMQQLLGYAGNDDVATIFKSMQLDIGTPPQFMDFRYQVHDDAHGEFRLAHCGALMDVEPMGEEFVVAMCHDIEDPTFPATGCATNPRARMTPIHRPPRQPTGRQPPCHWSVDIEPHHQPATDPAFAERVRGRLAAQLPITPIGPDRGSGPNRTDYAGELADVAPLADFSEATLRAVISEVALQGHLLVMSFFLAVADRTDSETAADITRRQLMGVGGITAERIRAAFDLGDDLDAIASVLNLHPAFLPRSYVNLRVQTNPAGDRLAVRIGDSPALHEHVSQPWATTRAPSRNPSCSPASARVPRSSSSTRRPATPGRETLRTVGPMIELTREPDRESATITLARPEKKNALSIALRDEISDALDALAADESIKSVVITGAGDVFCAGFDLSEFTAAAEDPELDRQLWASSDRYHRTVLTFPLPLVAAVNGPALAGGFDLAICCDMRIASETARFAHPEFSFGPVVYSPLHDLVGGAVARELCMTGRAVDVHEAHALRIVNEVCAPADLIERARAVAEMIAGAPRVNLMRTKAKAIERSRIAIGDTLDL